MRGVFRLFISLEVVINRQIAGSLIFVVFFVVAATQLVRMRYLWRKWIIWKWFHFTFRWISYTFELQILFKKQFEHGEES